MEALYFAFPFNLKHPNFRLHCHGGYYQVEEEQLPGSCRDWYCTQKWVNVEGKEGNIDWSAVEAPLVQLSDINTGKWLHQLPAERATIMSFAMNNHWWTNSPASISGRFWFNYAFTSRKDGFDPVKSHNFGWANHIPLTAEFVDFGKPEKGKRQYSMINKIPDNMVIVGMKQAESGKAVMVRMMETAGRKTGFSFGLGEKKIRDAYKTDPVEKRIAGLKIKDGETEVGLEPFEVVTFMFEI